jgi:hypothetical protein
LETDLSAGAWNTTPKKEHGMGIYRRRKYKQWQLWWNAVVPKAITDGTPKKITM